MSIFRPKYATNHVAMTVTNLHSLGSDAFWQSDVIDNTSLLAMEIELWLRLQTTTTAGAANGYANVWIAPSIKDTAEYVADATGSQGSYAPTTPSAAEQIKNAKFIGQVLMKADETTARVYEGAFSIPAAIGWMFPPHRFVIIVQNKTGTALNAAGNEVAYRAAQGESA